MVRDASAILRFDNEALGLQAVDVSAKNCCHVEEYIIRLF